MRANGRPGYGSRPAALSARGEGGAPARRGYYETASVDSATKRVLSSVLTGPSTTLTGLILCCAAVDAINLPIRRLHVAAGIHAVDFDRAG